ncbi:MAG: PDZ domain-containing protein, partial [Candidatus Pacearchaeota archaeon]|nr:PDZ domain-containing protein [Candidatus Pacearchaeota archaeon]
MKFTWKIWLLIILVVFSIISIFNFGNLFTDGVLVTSVGTNSTAFEQGLRQGDIITKIDDTTITSIEDFTQVLKDKYESEEFVKTIIQT